MSTDADYKPSSPVAQLGGAKRKNGHKANCSCHICENMKNKAKRGGYQEDIEKEALKKMGGSKKKNGHKPSCECPICKNMKHSKKGGENDNEEMSQTAGSKKKGNGHKANCKCPICKNMKKTSRKGGEEPDIENQLVDEEGQSTTANLTENETEATNSDYDALDAAEKGDAGQNIVGGTRKRRGSRKSNGHKTNCGCPICKNMRHGKKTRRHRKRSHRRH